MSSRWAVAIGRMTVRPDEPSAGPSPARIPVTGTLSGAPAPRMDSSEPRSRPSVAARRSVTRAPVSPVAGSGSPRTTTRSRTRGSRAGSIPRTVTGSVTIGRPGAEPMNDRRSIAGAVRATPGTASSACRVASDSPVSANAATRRSARPARDATVRSIEASSPAPVARAATSTATPIAIPKIVRTLRAGRATSPRQAYGTKPRMASC